jgi:hypothetical protein
VPDTWTGDQRVIRSRFSGAIAGVGSTSGVRVVVGRWDASPLGTLAPVWPEPGFGFGSTPRRPSVTAIVTTIEVG